MLPWQNQGLTRIHPTGLVGRRPRIADDLPAGFFSLEHFDEFIYPISGALLFQCNSICYNYTDSNSLFSQANLQPNGLKSRRPVPQPSAADFPPVAKGALGGFPGEMHGALKLQPNGPKPPGQCHSYPQRTYPVEKGGLRGILTTTHSSTSATGMQNPSAFIIIM